jgi:uncharacterized protein
MLLNFDHPQRLFYSIVKPIGPMCNLSCAYCFYLDKHRLYPQVSQ